MKYKNVINKLFINIPDDVLLAIGLLAMMILLIISGIILQDSFY